MAIDCVLVDIDGTLADCEHRRYNLDGEVKDWKSFLSPELAAQYTLHEPVAKVITALAQASHPMIYVSARNSSLRIVTENWLEEHNLWFAPRLLYLRKEGDTRADTIVKRELLQRIHAKGYHPILSFDDRNSVVAMWRDEGITCLQVADGDF